MKVSDYWQCYYDFSDRASSIARTLSLSAIALIWIFKVDTPGGGSKVPPELLPPAVWIVVSMTLDFVQYLYLSAVWRIHARRMEKRHGSTCETEFEHPHWIPAVGEVLFVAKHITLIVGYGLLIEYLLRRVF